MLCTNIKGTVTIGNEVDTIFITWPMCFITSYTKVFYLITNIGQYNLTGVVIAEIIVIKLLICVTCIKILYLSCRNKAYYDDGCVKYNIKWIYLLKCVTDCFISLHKVNCCTMWYHLKLLQDYISFYRPFYMAKPNLKNKKTGTSCKKINIVNY